MKFLAIDIGNTRVKYGFFNDGIFIKSWAEDASEVEAIKKNLIAHDVGIRYIISSVRPDTYDSLPNFGQQNILHHQSKMPIRLEYETPETLGADRIASVLGAYFHDANAEKLIIDAGTCITYDWLVENRYLGGNIAPGLWLRLRAMDEFTSNLPLGTFYDNMDMLGRTTNQALYNGAHYGILNEIKQYITSGPVKNPKVFLTGGDAEWITQHLDVEHNYSGDLILKGLHELYLYQIL